MRTRPHITALALAATLAAAPAVVASPAQVIADYRADGRIDGAYSLEELNGALKIAYRTRSASYGATADAIRAKQSEIVAGIHRRDSTPSPPATPAAGATPSATATAPAASAPRPGRTAPRPAGRPPAPSKASTAPATPPRARPSIAASELPSPPVATPGDRVPPAFVALSGLAGVLVLGGIGAGIARRLRGAPDDE